MTKNFAVTYCTDYEVWNGRVSVVSRRNSPLLVCRESRTLLLLLSLSFEMRKVVVASVACP